MSLSSIVKGYAAHLAGYVVAAATITTTLDPKVLPPQYTFITAIAGLVVAAAHHGYSAGVTGSAVAAAANAAANALNKTGTAAAILLCLTLGALAGSGLTGCASTAQKITSPQAQPYVQAAAFAAVATAEQHGVQATDINRIAKQALAADSGTASSLAEIANLVNAELAKLNLPAGDLQAAVLVEAGLNAAIQAQIGANASVAQYQAAVADVLQAIITATGG